MTRLSDLPAGVKRVETYQQLDGYTTSMYRNATDYAAHVYGKLAKQIGMYLLENNFARRTERTTHEPMVDTLVLGLSVDVYEAIGVDHLGNALLDARIQGLEDAIELFRHDWQAYSGIPDYHQTKLGLTRLVAGLQQQKDTE